MKITLKNNRFDASYDEAQDIFHLEQDVVVIPNEIYGKLGAAYIALGHQFEDGDFHLLPNPLSVLIGSDLLAVKIATAKYNRKKKEQIGIEWEGNRFETGVDACGTLSAAVDNMTSGLIAKTILNWRTADGLFIDMDVAKLTELLGIILQETEANYDAEKAEIEA